MSVNLENIQKACIRKYSTKSSNNVFEYPLLIPDMIDRNGDMISADEIMKSAIEFWKNMTEKIVNINHEDWTDMKEAYFVFNYVTTFEQWIEDKYYIPAWSWIVWIQVPDSVAESIRAWQFVWMSIEWKWKLLEIN